MLKQVTPICDLLIFILMEFGFIGIHLSGNDPLSFVKFDCSVRDAH